MQFVWNGNIIKSMPVRAYDPVLHDQVKKGRDDVLLTHWILANETDSAMYDRFPNSAEDAMNMMNDWVDEQLQRTNDTLGDPIGLRPGRPWTANSIASGMHGNDFPTGGGPHGSFSLPWDNDIAINLDMECAFFDASVAWYTLIEMNRDAGNILEMSNTVLNSIPSNWTDMREWIIDAWVAGMTRYKAAYPDNPVGCAYVPYLNRGSMLYWAAGDKTSKGAFMDSYFAAMFAKDTGPSARMLAPLDFATISATCAGTEENSTHWPFEWEVVFNNPDWEGSKLTDYFKRIRNAVENAGLSNKLVWEIHNNYGPVDVGPNFVETYYTGKHGRDEICAAPNGTAMNHAIKDKWGANNQFGFPNPIDDWGYKNDTYVPGGDAWYIPTDFVNGNSPSISNPFMTDEELLLWNRWYCGFVEPPTGWQDSPNIGDDTWLPFYPQIQTRQRYFGNGSDSDYARWRNGIVRSDSERPGPSGLYYRTNMERWWASGYGRFKTRPADGLENIYFVADRLNTTDQDSDWMKNQYLHYMGSIRDRGVQQKRAIPERRGGVILNGPSGDQTPIVGSIYGDVIDAAPEIGTNWKFVAHWCDDLPFDAITGEKVYSTLGSSEYGHKRGNELMFPGDPGCWFDPDTGEDGTLKAQPLTTGSEGGIIGEQVIWTPGLWYSNDETRWHILNRADLTQWSAMLECLYERMKNRVLSNARNEKDTIDSIGEDLVGEFGIMLYNMEIPNYDRCLHSIIQRAGLARLFGVTNNRTEISFEQKHVLSPWKKSCEGVPTDFPFDISSEIAQPNPTMEVLKQRLVISQIKLEMMAQTFVDIITYTKSILSESPTLPDGSDSAFTGQPGRRIALYQGPIGCDARYWHLCFNEGDLAPGAEGAYTLEVARDHIDGMINATLYDAWNGDATHRLDVTGLPDSFSRVTREEMDEIRQGLGLGTTKNIAEMMLGAVDFNNAEIYFSQAGTNMTMPLRNYFKAMEERLGSKAGIMTSHAYEMKAATSNTMNSCDQRPYEKHFPDVVVPTESDYVNNNIGGQVIGKFTGQVLENQTDQELDRNCVGNDFPWMPVEVWDHLVGGEDPVIPKTTMVINWGQWWPLTKWEWYLRGREQDGEPYPANKAFAPERLKGLCDIGVPDSFNPELVNGELHPGTWNTVGEFGDITPQNAINFYKFINYESQYARILFGLDPVADPPDPPITDPDPPLSDETLFIILQDSEIDPGTVDDGGGDPEDPGCGDTADDGPDINPGGTDIIGDAVGGARP